MFDSKKPKKSNFEKTTDAIFGSPNPPKDPTPPRRNRRRQQPEREDIDDEDAVYHKKIKNPFA
jgi:hypothetical protein